MADSIFGTITAPITGNKYFSSSGPKGSGIFLLISNVLKLAGVIAGIFFVIQMILAGFSYISANGDPKKVAEAWSKIWQSALGLIIVAGAFIIAGVIGRLTGINILNPTISGPND